MTDSPRSIQDVTAAWKEAALRFPGIDVLEARFEAALRSYSTARAGDQPGASELPPAEIAADLYLACACERGDDRAISVFRARYDAIVERVRRRFGTRAPSADELWSDLCEHLFVAEEGKPPRIGTYAGRSELGAWLRVVASRILLNRVQAPSREDPSDESLFEALLFTSRSAESSLARTEQKAIARRAFTSALASLDPRDRRLLKLAFSDGFTIDDLAALCDVHRSTTARWIRDATTRLTTRIAAIVRSELHLSAAEYESWTRDITSSMDLSVTRYLADAAASDAPT